MLYGAMLRCPHAHARLRSLDVKAAGKMRGVRAIIHAGSASAGDAVSERAGGPSKARMLSVCMAT